MSLPIKKILENLKKLNDKSDTQIDLYENGWYRIAKTRELRKSFPKALICKIGTSYNYQPPMNTIIAITTSYQIANIEILCTVLTNSTSKHIDKVRVQYDSANDIYYLDIHYSLTDLENTAYINFIARDGHWEFTNSVKVVEYDTKKEISL